MAVEVIQTTMEHVEKLMPYVRRADVEELYAASMTTPQKALEHGLRHSVECHSGIFDGEPACIFGVAPGNLLSGMWVPWLLGSEKLIPHQIAFLRHCRPVVGVMFERYPTLVNWVDERNTVAIRWLRWLGFDVYEPAPHGPFALPFRRFEHVRPA